ncbi:hypothetical protein ACOMHN_035715 [Nucella lapillus]
MEVDEDDDEYEDDTEEYEDDDDDDDDEVKEATLEFFFTVNAGRHEVKASRPSDRRTVPVVAVVSSVRHVRERTNHSTVAVTGDGGATPVTQASL